MPIVTKTIVACDVSSEKDLFDLLDQFDSPIYVKLGMEIIYKLGFGIIDKIKARKHQIFLDLKLHDIPNTVYHGIRNLAGLTVDMVNVHAAGGIEMMKAAKRAVSEVNPNTLCIAVTQLTSVDQSILEKDLLIKDNLLDVVCHYALNAKKSGLDGVVCSVHEVEKIHQICGQDFICVTPGIRLDANVQDQKRVATPRTAVDAGSDYIVVGRSIISSPNPKATYDFIEKIMQGEKNGKDNC